MRFYSFRLMIFLFVLIVGTSLTIVDAFGGIGSRVDVKYFSKPDSGPFLINPRYVRSNTRGKLMIWDRGLNQFVKIDPSGTEGIRRHSFSVDEVWNRKSQEQILNNWGIRHDPKGFWDGHGGFWVFGNSSKDRFTRFIDRNDTPGRTVTLPFNVQSVVPGDETWFVQSEGNREKLYRVGIDGGGKIQGTIPIKIQGKLVGVFNDGKVLSHSGGLVRIYEDNILLRSRRFGRIRSIQQTNGDIYVLNGRNELLQLNKQLNIEFSYQLRSGLDIKDIAITGGRVYVISESGFLSASLDQSQGSFFRNQARLNLINHASVIGSYSDVSFDTELWISKTGQNFHNIILKTNERTVRKLAFNGTGIITVRDRASFSSLSRDAFQYFQTTDAYWDGKDRLYYFFSKKKTVESYNKSGEIIRQTKLLLNNRNIVGDLKLLSANSEKIYMQGNLAYPDRGFRRSILIFNWEGKLERSFRLHHPEHDHNFPLSPAKPPLRSGGNGTIYELRMNAIQQYDSFGFPGQTYGGVYKPQDLFVTEQYIFLLDLGGNRLQVFNRTKSRNYRFATPPESFEVTGAYSTNRRRTIISGYSTRGSEVSKSRLYQYDQRNRSIQKILEHPTNRLAYPIMSAATNELYFWGKNRPDNPWRLYRSDLKKFAARPLSHKLPVRGRGFYSSHHRKLFVPVKTSDTKSAAYFQVDPDSNAKPLLNSSDLKSLTPTSSGNYFGVINKGDSNLLVSGYLNRESSTGPLRWTPADTIYRTGASISDINISNGQIYISIRSYSDFSRIGIIERQFVDERTKKDTGDVTVDWFFRSVGELQFISEREGFIRVLQKFDRHHGQIVDLYEARATGDFQGELTTNSLGALDGLKLRLDPGGHRVTTSQGGRFSFENIPVGFLQLIEGSYQFNFNYPIDISILENEYSIRSNIPIKREDNLLLLEKGLKFLRAGKFERARVAIEAFRELIRKGPYYNRTSGLLEPIYRRAQSWKKLRNLYKKTPRILSPREKMRLILKYRKNNQLNNNLLQSISSSETTFTGNVLTYLKNGLRESRKAYPYSPHPIKGLPSLEFSQSP